MIVTSLQYECFAASMKIMSTFLQKDDMQSATTEEFNFISKLYKERIRQASALKLTE